MSSEIMIEKLKQESIRYSIEHYKGSLDFPCDFCGNNSYDNLHITRDGQLIVICWDCIKQVKEG